MGSRDLSPSWWSSQWQSMAGGSPVSADQEAENRTGNGAVLESQRFIPKGLHLTASTMLPRFQNLSKQHHKLGD